MKDNGYSRIKDEGGPYDALIASACEAHGVPYDLLHKQLFKESSFNPMAVSPTGPRGLGQFTRATGKAYGLLTDDDFFDPTKSIDAAARYMKDNLKLARGDELKALLYYNQGAGKSGQAQAAAYDRGDFSGVSEEAVKYMRDLADVTNTGRSAELGAYVKPDGGFEAPAGIAKEPTAVPGGQPNSQASLGFTGVDVAPQATPFAQKLYETTGSTKERGEGGLFEGTKAAAEEGIKTSVLGMMVRAATQNQNANFMQTYTMMRDVFNDPMQNGRLSDWTDGDYDKLRNSGLDPQFYDVVLRGYRENFDQNLQLALENQKLVKDRQGSGLGAELVGGLASAAGDPWSLVNPGKGAAGGLGARLLGGALAGGAVGGMSELSASQASGKEAHVGAAIAGGAAFGGLLNGLLGKRPGKNSWDAEEGLSGDLLGPEGTPPGLPNEQPRLSHWVDGEASRILQIGEDQRRIEMDTNRLQSREKARQEGAEEDPTRMPPTVDDEIKESGSVPYMNAPFDSEAARTMDGTIHAGGSPLNPKTVEQFKKIDPFATKAQKGFRFGGLSEIGLQLARSNDDDIRGLAYDLFRSPTGYETGSNGKFGATASDIIERLGAQDNVALRQFDEHFDEALKDPYWKAQQGTRGGKVEQISRRVVEAMESKGQSPLKLTPPEQKLLESLRDHMAQKWDYIENPGQFGHLGAKSLLEETRHAGSYFPQRYSTAAKQVMLQRLGKDGLQEAVFRSWMASYAKRPEVRARVDKMITESLQKGAKEGAQVAPADIQKAVEKYARDKAFGISHTDQFNRSSVIEENLDGLVGLENNDYLQARNLFDSDVAINLPDGSMFSVNDLREFNIMQIVPSYNRRTNGDVALMGATGKTTKDLKDQAIALRQKAAPGGDAVDAEALEGALKLLTGRARRSPEAAWETAIRSLNDIGFVTKNAFMGAQNFTEAARMVVHGNLKMLLKGVPLLKEWTTAGTKLSADDMRDFHGIVFGRELDDLIRPSRQDIVDRLRQRSGEVTSQIVGSTKWATGELAARSPFTWVLRESGNLLLDAGRQGMLTHLADHTLNGKASDLFSPERLRSASITPEQFEGIQGLIREHFKQDAKGRWKIKNKEALASDVRSMDLWRLGDRYADEVMLRPHKMSLQSSKQYGALAAMVMQFKMFILRSLNGRLTRGWMESTRNGQALDQALQAVASVGLATAFYAASVQLKALGMPERAREKYKREAMSPAMLTYAAMSRSSHLGSPLSVWGFAAAPFGSDMAAAARTSILPRGEKQKTQEDRPIRYNPLQSDLITGFAARTAEQVPAANVAANAVWAGYSGANVLADKRGGDAQGHLTGLFNALKQFVPNDPLSQNLLQRLAEDQGVDRTR